MLEVHHVYVPKQQFHYRLSFTFNKN